MSFEEELIKSLTQEEQDLLQPVICEIKREKRKMILQAKLNKKLANLLIAKKQKGLRQIIKGKFFFPTTFVLIRITYSKRICYFLKKMVKHSFEERKML